MPKPKNTKMRELITSEAFRLFMKEGYEETSYKKIADSCNTSRPIIQYYFPKKEMLAIQFLERVLELTQGYLEENKILRNDHYIDLYLIIQVHFAFLLMNSDIKQFTQDFLASRKFTSNVAIMNSIWGLQFLKNPDKSNDKELFNNHLLILGGLFELIYYSLENKLNIDIQPYLLKTIIQYLTQLGPTHDEISSQLRPYMFDKKELDKICLHLLKRMEKS